MNTPRQPGNIDRTASTGSAGSTTSANTRPPTGGPVQFFYHSPAEPRRPTVARGQGIYLWDTSGKRYIDASSGPIAVNLGHGNERVMQAAMQQMQKVSFASRVFFENEANTQLADLIAEHAGPGFERAFFVSGGSEATEAAMKLARQHAVLRGQAGRWKVISRNPSYHGSTLGAVAVSGDFVSEEMYGSMARIMPKVPAPLSYRIPEGHTADTYAMACADELERVIEREGPESVLAFIMEPVGGLATGALVSTEAYCRKVREICSRHGVLLIFDEVMSGVGRTGTFLTSHQFEDFEPDLVTLAKGLASGYTPLGAVLASRAMVDDVASEGGFQHGHTYSSNPLSCAIGVATVQETIERKLAHNAAVMGAYLSEQLRALQDRHTIIGDVRGKGLLMALEIVSDTSTKAMFPANRQAISTLVNLAMQRGLLLYSRRTAQGRYGEWLMVAPPLIVTRQEIDLIVALIDDTLSAFSRQI